MARIGTAGAIQGCAMNETNALDMLGQLGGVNAQQPSRKKSETGDFASQFMAMLFDDSSNRAHSHPERTDRTKTSKTGTDGKTSDRRGSESAGEVGETAPEERSGGNRAEANALFQISPDLLARRVLSGSFDREDARAGSALEKTPKEAIREPGEGSETAQVKLQSNTEPRAHGKVADEVKAQSIETLEQVDETSASERAVRRETHKGQTGRATHSDAPGEAPTETGDTHRAPSGRASWPGAEKSPVAERTHHAPMDQASADVALSSSKIRSVSSLHEPVDPAAPPVREMPTSAGRGAPVLRSPIGHQSARAFHESEHVQGIQPEAANVGTTRLETKDAGVPPDTRPAGNHREERPADPGRSAMQSSGAKMAHQPTLQSLVSTITRETVTRAGKASNTVVEKSEDQGQRSHEPRIRTGSTTTQRTARADVGHPGSAHGHTSARNDSRPDSSAIDGEGPRTSQAEDATHGAAGRREDEASLGHRQESESTRVSRPSTNGHETTSLKEVLHTGVDVLAGTPTKGDLAGSSIRSAVSHSAQSPAGPPDFGRILNQIVDSARLEQGAGLNRFTVQLKPDFLGRIEIETELADGAAMRAVIRVEDPSVRKAVETGLAHLVHKLNELGLDITSAKVADFMPQNDGQGQPHSDSGSSGTKSRHGGGSGRGFTMESDREEGPIGHDDGSFSYFA